MSEMSHVAIPPKPEKKRWSGPSAADWAPEEGISTTKVRLEGSEASWTNVEDGPTE